MKRPTTPTSEPRKTPAPAVVVVSALLLSMVVTAPPAVSLEGPVISSTGIPVRALAGGSGGATGVSPSGVIAGTTRVDGGPSTATRWASETSAGVQLELGWAISTAVDISDEGVIVGNYKSQPGSSYFFPYTWTSTDGGVGTPIPSDTWVANDILVDAVDAAGHQVGDYTPDTGGRNGWTLGPTDGRAQNIGSPNWATSAFPADVDGGNAVGVSGSRPFLLDISAGTWTQLPAPNTDGNARAIDGQVAAGNVLANDGSQQAVVWSLGASLSILATIPGLGDGVTIPTAITTIGGAPHVVGYYYRTASTTTQRAFHWSPATGATDLGTLGGSGGAAQDINAAGQIVGSAQLVDRSSKPVVWNVSDITGPQALSASVLAPEDAVVFGDDAVPQFFGTAADPEDGNLTGENLVWSSDLDGGLGTGQSLTPTLSPGSHRITLTATDSAGNTATDSLTVTVLDSTLQPPTVTIANPADGSTFTEGESITFSGSASDPQDGSLLTDWSSSLDGVLQSGSFGFFSYSTLSVGVHVITASATDSDGNTGSDAITVTVESSGNGAPVLEPIEDQRVGELNELRVPVTASDPDGDTVTLSLQTAPDGATMSDGDVVWTPTEAQGPGSYSFTVAATDGLAEHTQSFQVTVNEVNSAPTVAPIPDQEVVAGTQLTFSAEANDTDVPANTITWSLGSTAPTAATIDEATGEFAWTPEVADIGTSSFDVIASDGTTSTAEPVTVTVTAPPDAAVVFSSNRDGDYDLWTIPPDGGTPTQLANLAGDDNSPRWSPDGTQIAFVKNPNTLNGRLWIVNADGTGARSISTVQTRFAPAWSPDGTQIAFVANSGDGDFDLHIVAPDGSNQQKIADTAANETSPTWLDAGVLVDRGTDAVLVNPGTGDDISTFPVGSASSYDAAPDGVSVAFRQATGSGVSRVAVLDTLTGSITGVTDGAATDGGPTWSPDGRELLFNRRADSTDDDDLYRIRLDGTGLTQLTTDSANDLTPDWFGTVTAFPPVELVVSERVGVADDVAVLPPVELLVAERVGVGDEVTPLLSVQVLVSERIGVRDVVDVNGPVELVISEGIGVADDVTVLPPVELLVSERVGVGDEVTPLLSVQLFVSERIGVSDAVDVNGPVELVISEGIGVADDVPVLPPVELLVSERVGVGDEVTPLLSVQLFVSERIGVNDQPSVPLGVDVVVDQGVGVTDTITITTVTDGEVSSATLQPDGTYDFSGDGFAPDSPIDIGLESEFLLLQTTIADATGAFAVTITIPPATALPDGFLAGPHTLVAKGLNPQGVPHQVRTPVRVLAPIDVELDEQNPAALTTADTGQFTLAATLSAPDPPLTDADPDLSNATITLEPIGPGSTINGDCSPDTETLDTINCSFDSASVPVNTYTVIATYDGDDLYYGVDEALLTMQDPTAGYTSGGGWFQWPTTGERTHVAFNISHNRKGSNVRGQFTLLRKTDDGTHVRLKSNAIDGLALGSRDGVPWASFQGKATYTDGRTDQTEGNHTFLVYVEDEPDRLWLQVRDRDGAVVTEVSLAGPAVDEAVELERGQILVPEVARTPGRRIR